jgi:hypothetical protein
MISTGLRIAVDTFNPAKFYKKHKCLVISALAILLFTAILAVSYHAPHMEPTEKELALEKVAEMIEETAPCGGSGFPEVGGRRGAGELVVPAAV